MWTTMKNNLLGKIFLSCSFYLYSFRKYKPYGFPIINFCNPGVHYEKPCIKIRKQRRAPKANGQVTNTLHKKEGVQLSSWIVIVSKCGLLTVSSLGSWTVRDYYLLRIDIVQWGRTGLKNASLLGCDAAWLLTFLIVPVAFIFKGSVVPS